MMARVGDIAGRLYRGEVSFNFVGRQRLWYTISGLILLVSVVALLTRGLNFSEEFKGGSSFQFPANSSTQPGRDLAGGELGGRRRRDRAAPHRALPRSGRSRPRSLVPARDPQVASAISSRRSTSRSDQISDPFVGPTWGGQITHQGHRGADHLPRRDRDLPVDRVRVEDGHRRVRRAAARHRDHDRRVRADRLPGSPDDRDRPADHPRLLAVRHRGGLRQGPGEYRRPAHHASEVHL